MLSKGSLLGSKLGPSSTKRSIVVNVTIQVNISVVDVNSLLEKFSATVNGRTRLLALTDSTDRTNALAKPSIHCVFEIYDLATDDTWLTTLNALRTPMNTGGESYLEVRPWLATEFLK